MILDCHYFVCRFPELYRLFRRIPSEFPLLSLIISTCSNGRYEAYGYDLFLCWSYCLVNLAFCHGMDTGMRRPRM
jgi:hypothetical protein